MSRGVRPIHRAVNCQLWPVLSEVALSKQHRDFRPASPIGEPGFKRITVGITRRPYQQIFHE